MPVYIYNYLIITCLYTYISINYIIYFYLFILSHCCDMLLSLFQLSLVDAFVFWFGQFFELTIGNIVLVMDLI